MANSHFIKYIGANIHNFYPFTNDYKHLQTILNIYQPNKFWKPSHLCLVET